MSMEVGHVRGFTSKENKHLTFGAQPNTLALKPVPLQPSEIEGELDQA